MTEEQIKRINELYHKSKNEGLTEMEKKEQAALRSAYMLSIRENLRGQLNNIDVQNEDGSVTNLGEKYGTKHGNKAANQKTDFRGAGKSFQRDLP